MHFADLGKALDAINPNRQGVEIYCCLRGMLRPGISKVTSTWTPPKVAPDFISILAIRPFMQPRIDPPPDHAWSTMQTCEAILVTNTKRRTAKRSLNRRLKEYNDGAWMVNPASFECYLTVEHDDVELICCHMPAKIHAPENEVMKNDAPVADVDNMFSGSEWNSASASPPKDFPGPCPCPFFRNDSASKAQCSHRPRRFEH